MVFLRPKIILTPKDAKEVLQEMEDKEPLVKSGRKMLTQTRLTNNIRISIKHLPLSDGIGHAAFTVHQKMLTDGV